jgi:hypothetical protein
MWKYKIGTVVREKERDALGLGLYSEKDSKPMFGHVVGFDRVEYDHSEIVYDHCYETILRVRWEDGSEKPIHPTNVLVEGDL